MAQRLAALAVATGQPKSHVLAHIKMEGDYWLYYDVDLPSHACNSTLLTHMIG